jgi:hypothetical protein
MMLMPPIPASLAQRDLHLVPLRSSFFIGGSLSASQKHFFVLAATSHDAPTKHATIGARG